MADEFEAAKSTQTAKMYLGSQVEPMVLDYLDRLTTNPESVSINEHALMISKQTVSDDVESMLSRWLKDMEFHPAVRVQSDKKGYDCYVLIDFRNPHVVSEWRAFLTSQYRIATNTKSDDLTAGARRIGSFRVQGQDTSKAGGGIRRI